MKCVPRIAVVGAAMLMVLGLVLSSAVSAEDKKPNILVIMGDDVDWFNIGA